MTKAAVMSKKVKADLVIRDPGPCEDVKVEIAAPVIVNVSSELYGLLEESMFETLGNALFVRIRRADEEGKLHGRVVLEIDFDNAALASVQLDFAEAMRELFDDETEATKWDSDKSVLRDVIGQLSATLDALIALRDK